MEKVGVKKKNRGRKFIKKILLKKKIAVKKENSFEKKKTKSEKKKLDILVSL